MDTREPPFNDVHVRQALNDAVDRDAIAKLYGGLRDATPTCQIIPATIPGHEPYCPSPHPPPPPSSPPPRSPATNHIAPTPTTSRAPAGSSPPPEPGARPSRSS